MARIILAYENLSEPFDNSQQSRLKLFKQMVLVPPEMLDIFHTIKNMGNKASHEGYGNTDVAAVQLSLAFRLGDWLTLVYGDLDYQTGEFVLPPPEEETVTKSEMLRRMEQLEREHKAKLAQMKKDLELLRQKQVPLEKQKDRRKKSHRAASQLVLNEQETRQLIDNHLSNAGWEVNSQTLKYARGARPEKNKNRAIAEWPTASGYADYALFAGLTLVALVEAKKKAKDVISDLEQAKRYAREIEHVDQAYLPAGGPWGKYQVPFLFATNSRPYLKQIETKSGIWFLDARKRTNHPRALQGWHSPGGLLDLLKQDIKAAHARLKSEPMDYLKLRYYQLEAIKAVENAIQKNQREILIAMATGTGKTRTTIGLSYRLIKSKRFKRILFLVDRSALGEQAEDAFKEAVLEQFLNFTQIYDVKGLEDKTPESHIKVHIATVQGMIKRIFYGDDQDRPTVDWYDCIVVDEAHRGYLLDKEMGELELELRDQADYISKYRQVLEYFDAVKVGLTATPALHTVQIFGSPVYTYSYRDAVVDGYLVDHEPPLRIETKLKKSGIKWGKGDTVKVFDSVTGQSKDIANLPDELSFDVSHFNKKVSTESFNRTVIKELVKHLDPTGLDKTLIFAASDEHADLVVKLLKEEFDAIGAAVDDDAIKKITGSIDEPLKTIRQYKNERLPNIAVTVDLLTTGIDVPDICSLVFLRRVRSRILYEQMLGRATRLCDRINKTHFSVFDAVGIYEILEPVTNMKPVVVNPCIPLSTLAKELGAIQDGGQMKAQIEALAAKIRRKQRRISRDDVKRFSVLASGQSLDEFINWLLTTPVRTVQAELPEKMPLLELLDGLLTKENIIFISNHQDQLQEVFREYDSTKKPQDYLEEFNTFIQNNLNKIPALQIVVQRPKELTRKTLRELKVELDRHGFSETKLNTAWRELKNEDIVADIISFIRQQALGDALVSHAQRIKNAMQKVRGMQQWTRFQQNWLDRIEKQLLKETIIDRAAFDDEEPFKGEGGFARMDKIFGGQLEEIMQKINDSLFNGRSSA